MNTDPSWAHSGLYECDRASVFNYNKTHVCCCICETSCQTLAYENIVPCSKANDN